ncbi:MAG TPA: NnrU family protein [Phycisphaerae bacterium]|nr:NnrU family protein [Phycisphaerae bacterium]HVY05558.1 NnrU family protein [Burkholderiales bacterium]
MAWLIAGIALFFGVHVLTSLPILRGRVLSRLGGGGYKGLYSLASFAGLGLIVAGMARSPFVPLWNAPEWGRHAAVWLMPVAFILVFAAYIPGNIKRATAHPMLWGVTLWALLHLLANGDLAGLLLFGGFGLYSLYAMWSQNRRGARAANSRRAVTGDIAAIVAGLVAYALLRNYHGTLFGVAV